MTRSLRLLLLGGLLVASSAFGGPIDKLKTYFSKENETKPTTVKVLLASEVDGAMVQMTGRYNVYDPYTGRRLATRFSGKAAFAQPVFEGLRWGELFPGVFQIALVPDHENSTVLVDGKQYRGTLYIYQVEDHVNIVNEVTIEDYIASTLGSQFDQPLNRESMAAVAIVARTEALHAVANPKNDFWDVRASDVGYVGYSSVHRHPEVTEAVAATRNMVMTAPYAGHRESFPAKWTKHSAGRTISYQEMYRHSGAPNIDGVAAPFAQESRDTTYWISSVNKAAIARVAGFDKVTELRLFRDEASNKVIGVQVRNGNYRKDMDFATLQELLGEKILKSSEFNIEDKGDIITFSGYGEGAGVGLCVYSAEKLADRGENAAEILGHFFPDAKVQNIPGSRPYLKNVADRPARNSKTRERRR